MAKEEGINLFSFIEERASHTGQTDGQRVYPSFASVRVTTPRDATYRVFAEMEAKYKRYDLNTAFVHSILGKKDGFADFHLRMIGKDDLERWEYYIELYKAAVGPILDEWVSSRTNGLDKAITIREEQDNLLLSLFYHFILTLKL